MDVCPSSSTSTKGKFSIAVQSFADITSYVATFWGSSSGDINRPQVNQTQHISTSVELLTPSVPPSESVPCSDADDDARPYASTASDLDQDRTPMYGPQLRYIPSRVGSQFVCSLDQVSPRAWLDHGLFARIEAGPKVEWCDFNLGCDFQPLTSTRGSTFAEFMTTPDFFHLKQLLLLRLLLEIS